MKWGFYEKDEERRKESKENAVWYYYDDQRLSLINLKISISRFGERLVIYYMLVHTIFSNIFSKLYNSDFPLKEVKEKLKM